MTVVEFDISDVPVSMLRTAGTRPGTEPIPIDEDDMLEAACLLPQRPRIAGGTLPPPFESAPQCDGLIALNWDREVPDGA